MMRRLLAALLALAFAGPALAQSAGDERRRLSAEISRQFTETARVEHTQRFGAVTLIRAEFTERANGNEQYLVRDRTGAVRMVASLAEAFEREAQAALGRRHADPAMWPATQAFLGARTAGDGQVTLRFAMPITAQCRACEVIGVAHVAIDFDAAGGYRGTRLERAASLARNETWDRGAVRR